MNENHLHVHVPADVYVPGKSFGIARAEVRLTCPDDMTPDRFREIAKSKDAKVGWSCFSLSPKYGPYLEAEWMEGGAKVVLCGVVDEAAGRRERAA